MQNKIILGTVQLGLDYGINNQNGKPSRDEAFDILNIAKQHGIKTLDTAQAYGDAIDIIGEFNKENKPFHIITKFAFPEHLDIEEYFNSLIQKLNIDTLEAVLFHRFSELTAHSETVKALSKLKQKKLINKIGVSVYTNEELLLAAGIDEIDLIQFPFNLLDNYSLRYAGIQKAVQQKKTIHVRSVFLQGLFFMSVNNLPELLKPLKPYLDMLHQIASAQNISVNELALKYVLQTDEIDGVLIGVESAEQLKTNISLLNKEPLNQSVIERINSIHVPSTELLNPVNWK